MTDNKIILHAVRMGDDMIVTHDGNYFGQPMASVPMEAKKADKITPPIPSWTDPGTQRVFWGDNDRLPTDMREKVELVPIAGATLNKKVNMLTGNGIIYYKTADLKKGVNVERHYDQAIEDFLEDNRIQTEWFLAQAADYCLPYNCFSELVQSVDRKKITGLYHIGAEHARLSKANTNGQVDYLQYSYHFPFGTADADSNRVAMPLYKWYDREKFFAGLQGRKFGWHTRFPTPGLIYYARAWWMGLFRKGGWLDVSANVSRIVNAMQNNQITLKYTIAIPETYFIIRHVGKWQAYEPLERQKIIDDKIQEINRVLAGSDNVYKSIAYVFKQHEISGESLGKIEITPVDDKAKSGLWVPDSYMADAQIVQGLGMDPSQIGLASPGKPLGAGSGSDKRESYNLMITLNTPEQRLILEPLNFISSYNGWGVTFVIDHTAHTTTNDKETGLKPGNNTTQVTPAQPAKS